MPHISSKPAKPFPFPDERDGNDALVKAVNALTAWLKANAGAATKADLEATEARLLKALGERVSPAAIRELDAAVKANTPPISGS